MVDPGYSTEITPGYAVEAVAAIRKALEGTAMLRCRYCKHRYLPPFENGKAKPTTSCGMVRCRMAADAAT
jgi:hypothetical protein